METEILRLTTNSHLSEQYIKSKLYWRWTEETLTQLFCSASLTAELRDQIAFLSVLYSFLSVIAFLGNALILIALHKESSLHPPSKLLLRCLATTDPCAVLFWSRSLLPTRCL